MLRMPFSGRSSYSILAVTAMAAQSPKFGSPKESPPSTVICCLKQYEPNPMNHFQKLNQSDPRYSRFFKELVESEIKNRKKQEQVLNRIARNFHAARNAINNRGVDLFAAKSVESLEGLIYKTHRNSQVERYANDVLSGLAKSQTILEGEGRERALQAFGRIMDLKLSHKKAQERFFKGVSAVNTSQELANLLENLLDSDIMEKVASSKAVVEYDDGRLALVWIPDYYTAREVGSPNWHISKTSHKPYWTQNAKGLSKWYMIIDRGLPELHQRYRSAFRMKPNVKVWEVYDQSACLIDIDMDNDFQQALKMTGARPYNRADVLKYDNDSLLYAFIEHHKDSALLSKRVLAADNPTRELKRSLESLKVCAEVNLPSCLRLVLTVARQFTKAEKGPVINLSFAEALESEVVGLDVVGVLLSMMPGIAAAQKHCTPEILEFMQCRWTKTILLENAIRFGNRTMIASLLKSPWEHLYKLDIEKFGVEKVLALGPKTNRLLIDSGLLKMIDPKSIFRAVVIPRSEVHKEAADVYFSTPWIQYSPDFADSFCDVLEKACSTLMITHRELINGRDRTVLAHMPWLLGNLKRTLGENSALYAKQIGTMLAAVANGSNVEMGVVFYSPEINLLLDEVNRLGKQADKKALAELSHSICNINTGCADRYFNINFSEYSLPEEGRAVLGRLLTTMMDYGAEVSQVYMALLAREGDFERIAKPRHQGEKVPPVSIGIFLKTALGRSECREGSVSEQWLSTAESWLQGNRSWFQNDDKNIIGELLRS